MRRLVYLDSALDDLDSIFQYIAWTRGNADPARQLTQRLRDQCARLARLPTILGRSRDELRPNLRSFPNPPYVIFFEYAATKLTVINILHARRDIDAFFTEGP